jgi:hypothetical protein
MTQRERENRPLGSQSPPPPLLITAGYEQIINFNMLVNLLGTLLDLDSELVDLQQVHGSAWCSHCWPVTHTLDERQKFTGQKLIRFYWETTKL